MKKLNQKAKKNRGKRIIVCGAVLVSIAAVLLSGCGSTLSGEDSTTAADKVVSGTNTFVYDDEDAEAPVSTTLYAVVTAVDGSEITLAVSDTDFTSVSGITDIGGGMKGMDDADGDTMGKGSFDGKRGRSDDSSDDAIFPDGEFGEAPDDVPSGGDMPGDMSEKGEMRDFSNDDMTGGMGKMGDMDITDIGTVGFPLETVALTIGDKSVILVEVESEDAEDSSEAENYESGSLNDIAVGAVLEIGFDENGEITFILVTTQTIDTDMLESWPESSDGTEDGDNSDENSESSGGSNGGSMGGSSSSISYETEFSGCVFRKI